jgi:hypothetical protein
MLCAKPKSSKYIVVLLPSDIGTYVLELFPLIYVLEPFPLIYVLEPFPLI